MDKFLNKLTDFNLGYRMGNSRINMVGYADDAAFIVKLENNHLVLSSKPPTQYEHLYQQN